MGSGEKEMDDPICPMRVSFALRHATTYVRTGLLYCTCAKAAEARAQSRFHQPRSTSHGQTPATRQRPSSVRSPACFVIQEGTAGRERGSARPLQRHGIASVSRRSSGLPLVWKKTGVVSCNRVGQSKTTSAREHVRLDVNPGPPPVFRFNGLLR